MFSLRTNIDKVFNSTDARIFLLQRSELVILQRSEVSYCDLIAGSDKTILDSVVKPQNDIYGAHHDICMGVLPYAHAQDRFS
jgi:hypothetical protein